MVSAVEDGDGGVGMTEIDIDGVKIPIKTMSYRKCPFCQRIHPADGMICDECISHLSYLRYTRPRWEPSWVPPRWSKKRK